MNAGCSQPPRLPVPMMPKLGRSLAPKARRGMNSGAMAPANKSRRFMAHSICLCRPARQQEELRPRLKAADRSRAKEGSQVDLRAAVPGRYAGRFFAQVYALAELPGRAQAATA